MFWNMSSYPLSGWAAHYATTLYHLHKLFWQQMILLLWQAHYEIGRSDCDQFQDTPTFMEVNEKNYEKSHSPIGQRGPASNHKPAEYKQEALKLS
jgi:hypothetical protein